MAIKLMRDSASDISKTEADNLGVTFNRFGFADSVFIHVKPERFNAYMVDVPDCRGHNGDNIVFLIKTVYEKEFS